MHQLLEKEKLDCALGSPQELAEKLKSLELLKQSDGVKLQEGGFLAFDAPAARLAEKKTTPWQQMTKASRFGKTHPDTFFCNDLPKLKKDFPASIPRIQQLDFYSDGSQIFGYEVVYEP